MSARSIGARANFEEMRSAPVREHSAERSTPSYSRSSTFDEDGLEVVEVPAPPISTKRLILLTLLATIGGFLFGYDTGVISGALPYIRDDLLTGMIHSPSKLARIQETIVSGAVIGAGVGSAVGGRVADLLGRRPSLGIADLLFIAGSVVMAAANSPAVLIVGRVVVGLAIGIASTVVPIMIGELSPTHLRAKLVTLNVLVITAGQFISYLVNYGFAHVPGNWRWMLGIGAVPAFIQLVGLVLLPESKRHRDPKTKSAELWAQLKRKSVWKQLHIGLGLQALQQLAGINTVMYFTPSILQAAGVRDKQTVLLLSLGPAAINAAGTVVGMFCIERVGRRRLLLWSTALVVSMLALLSGGFACTADHSPVVTPEASTCSSSSCSGCVNQGCVFCAQHGAYSEPGTCLLPDFETYGSDPCPDGTDSFTQGCPSPCSPLVLVGLMLYLACFSPGLGPVPWAVNAELYPPGIRATAMGMACVVNWAANALASQTFLTLLHALGGIGTWALYAGIAAVGWIWVFVVVPETKGKSLEEIQAMFDERGQMEPLHAEAD